MEKTTNRLKREVKERNDVTGVRIVCKCKTKNNFFHTLTSFSYDFKSHDILLKEVDNVCEDIMFYLKALTNCFNGIDSCFGKGKFWLSSDDEMIINKEEVIEIWTEIGEYSTC